VDGISTREALMAEIVTFFGMPVGLDIVPDAVTVERGDTLRFSVTLTNHALSSQSLWGLGEVTLPNGNPYSGNPIDGPVFVTLDPGETKQLQRSHRVPIDAPLGLYTYTGKLGLPPDSLVAQDAFSFVVAP
jgi:hypothetical protein